MSLSRRKFIGSSLASGAAVSLSAAGVRLPAPHAPSPTNAMLDKMIEEIGTANQGKRFQLKYGPHFGMFRNHAGDDPVDQLKFAAEEGFHAWEDNGMPGRSVADQERIGKAMADLGITMGVFVVNGGTAWGSTLASGKKDSLDKFLGECKAAVDVAKPRK